MWAPFYKLVVISVYV